MRFLELLLLLANWRAVLALMFPQSKQVPWMHQLALASLLLAGAQWLVEGLRWQLVSAYALSRLVFLVWARQRISIPSDEQIAPQPAHRPSKQWGTGRSLAGVGVAGWLPVAFPVFRCPVPSGPRDLGTAKYHWVDAQRPNIFSPNAQARHRRGLRRCSGRAF